MTKFFRLSVAVSAAAVAEATVVESVKRKCKGLWMKRALSRTKSSTRSLTSMASSLRAQALKPMTRTATLQFISRRLMRATTRTTSLGMA